MARSTPVAASRTLVDMLMLLTTVVLIAHQPGVRGIQLDDEQLVGASADVQVDEMPVLTVRRAALSDSSGHVEVQVQGLTVPTELVVSTLQRDGVAAVLVETESSAPYGGFTALRRSLADANITVYERTRSDDAHGESRHSPP